MGLDVVGVRYPHVVEVLHPVIGQDEYTGNETRTYPDADTTGVPLRATVQPAGTTELLDRRQVTISRWSVLAEPGDVDATDRIRWQGEDYEVDGDVGVFYTRRRPHHLEFTVRRIQG